MTRPSRRAANTGLDQRTRATHARPPATSARRGNRRQRPSVVDGADSIAGSAAASACTTSASNCEPAQRHSSRSASARAARRTIGARAGHRVERVGDVDDAGQQRDLVAAQPVRIALAVGPLVVQLDDRQVRREEVARCAGCARRRRDAARSARIPRPSAAPACAGRASLMPILPMSCSSAPSRRISSWSAAQRHLPADRDRQRADPLGVAGGVRIPRVERQRERADGADVGAAASRPRRR